MVSLESQIKCRRYYFEHRERCLHILPMYVLLLKRTYFHLNPVSCLWASLQGEWVITAIMLGTGRQLSHFYVTHFQNRASKT